MFIRCFKYNLEKKRYHCTETTGTHKSRPLTVLERQHDPRLRHSTIFQCNPEVSNPGSMHEIRTLYAVLCIKCHVI